MTCSIIFKSVAPPNPRCAILRTQKLKTYLFDFGSQTQNSKALPFKLGAGQYIAAHVAPGAWDFFLANFFPSSPFTCIFLKTSHDFFPALAVANIGSFVSPQNKISDPAHPYKQLVQVPVLSARVI